MNRAPALIALAAITITTLSACSSPPHCTTSSCAAAEIQKSLTGVVTGGGSVMTTVTCTGAREISGQWIANCTVDYSNGQVWDGSGNWDLASDDVTFNPQTEVSGG